MRIEAIVLSNCNDSYPFDSGHIIGFNATLQAIINDLVMKIDKRIIATKFHNTIISAIFETAKAIRKKESLNKVVLSGGVFQNKYILEGTIDLLEKYHFEVFSHCSIPTNDGGIALGQLAIASKRRSLKCV
jgi:hydrogenase maturation protein HypF